MILLGSNHYSSPAAIFNTHSIDLEASSSQYLSISDASQTGLDITGDMTIEFWWNPESLPNQINLIYKWGASDSYLLRYINSSKLLYFYISDDGSTNTNGNWSWTPTLGQWYHLAIVYYASLGEAELFINGVSQGVKTGLDTSIFNGTEDFRIGSSSSNTIDGLIDDVRIWNVARTSTEIANNFNKELTGTEANLQGYWKLNNSPNDLTSNANHLTETNSPVYTTDTPF